MIAYFDFSLGGFIIQAIVGGVLMVVYFMRNTITSCLKGLRSVFTSKK